jgi:phospholipid/cholesterol/gamma-HCH transport system substrate-binding protein
MTGQRSRRSRVAALIAVVAVAALAAIVLTSGGGTYTVTAVFRQSYGLVPGGQVWSGGGVVGSITDLRLGPDGLPHIRMSIKDDYQVRATATADLRLGSNSGELNRIIVLTTGRGSPMRDGGVIPVARTSAPVELDDVAGMLTPAVRSDLHGVIAQLDAGTRDLDGAFRATLQHSAKALDGSASLIEQVSADGAALRTVVSQGRIATGAFASPGTRLDAATDEVSGLLATTAGRQAAMRAAVRALPESLAAAQGALGQLRGSIPTLSRLFDAAGPVVPQLRSTAAVAADTLPQIEPGLREVARTARMAPRRLRQLTPLLRIARPFAQELAPTLRRALPILDVARVYTPEVTGFLSGWSDMNSTYDGAGHIVTLGVNAVPPPNRVVSPASNDPGYLLAPFQRLPGALVGQGWTDYKDSFLSKPGGGGR